MKAVPGKKIRANLPNVGGKQRKIPAVVVGRRQGSTNGNALPATLPFKVRGT